jgi:hypothetical protein
MVLTSKLYIRDGTTVNPFAVVLFGGALRVYNHWSSDPKSPGYISVVTVDEWLRFRMASRPATMVKHVREQMEARLFQRIIAPTEMSHSEEQMQPLIDAIGLLLQQDLNATMNGRGR